MLLLGNFIAEKTLAWTAIHSWVSNSTTEELLYRLIFYASDCFWLTHLYENDPERARTISSSKTVLTTLCGHNVQLIPNEPLDSTIFLHQQQNMMPLWRKTAAAFNTINHGLKEFKYNPCSDDPNYRSGPNPISKIRDAKELLVFEGHQLKMAYMPMPVLAVLAPLFR